jgi:hypothetical protein
MSKRAMKVMLVGLVAMLGVKAEAHWKVVAGKLKFCSVCIEVELEEDRGTVDPNTHTEEVEFRLMTEKVEILCPGGTVVQSEDKVTLVVRKPIDQGDMKGVVSDTAFLAKPNFCPGSKPLDVLIRATKVEIKTYACYLPDPSTPEEPPTCEQVREFVKLNCKLPNKFNFKNYPKNYPPKETLYVCS